MITELTKEQIELIPMVRDKWIKIGLNCEPVDLKRAKTALELVYKSAKLVPPKYIFITDSPISGSIFEKYLRPLFKTLEQTDKPLRQVIREEIKDQVREQVRGQVGGQVREQVGGQVWEQVMEQVWEQVREQVWGQVGGQVWRQVGGQVWRQVWEQLIKNIENQIYGSHEAWLSSYDYLGKLGLNISALHGLIELANSCGWWTPLENVAILQHRHDSVYLKNRVLHKDGGPAIHYRDGFSIWALNGVQVPQWLAELPTGSIDPKRLIKIDNAEVRREFVRKVGIERICVALNAKSIDTMGNYSLLILDLGDGRRRPYLKMRNPSIDTWHLEGIHPSCTTVEQALRWRNETEERPITLT